MWKATAVIVLCLAASPLSAQTLSSAEYAKAGGIHIGQAIACGIERPRVAPVLDKELNIIGHSAKSEAEAKASIEILKATMTSVIDATKANGGKNCPEVRRDFALLWEKSAK
jgi:20S proteasome alpha/beta subunit